MTSSRRWAFVISALLVGTGCFSSPPAGGATGTGSSGAHSSTTAAGSTATSAAGTHGSTAATVTTAGTGGHGTSMGTGSSGVSTSLPGFAAISGASSGATTGTIGTGTTGTPGTSGVTAIGSNDATGTLGSTGTNGFTTGTNGLSTGTTGVSIGTGTVGTSGTTATFGTTQASIGTATATGTNGGPTTGTNGFTTGTNGLSTGTTGVSIGTGTTGTTGTNGFTTGSTGHATSTGTVTSIGATASSSSGSTGTNDCRSNGCGYGEQCLASPTPSGTLWLCQCSQAGTMTGDSCTGNPSGATVCDTNTLSCAKPTDYQECDPTAATDPCASGYVCLSDGEGGGLCLQSCNSTSECTLSYAQCLPSGSGNVCQIDECGPSSGPPANGSYYGACNLVGTNDGYCEPFANGPGAVIGYCMGSGPVATGGYCPGFGVDESEQCVAGDICFSFGLRFRDGGVSQQCFQVCDASASGNSCPGNSACYPNDPTAQTTPDPGYCFP